DQQSHTSMRVAYIVISLHLDAALISSPCTLSLHAALPICVVDQQVQAYLRREEAVVQHPAGGGHGHEQGHGHRQRQQARLAQPLQEVAGTRRARGDAHALRTPAGRVTSARSWPRNCGDCSSSTAVPSTALTTRLTWGGTPMA